MAELWVLEPHCCRHCFGRLVSRADGNERVYRCTNCGVERSGLKSAVLCACGATVHRKGGGDVNLGLRCVENKTRTPECPSEIVAEGVG